MLPPLSGLYISWFTNVFDVLFIPWPNHFRKQSLFCSTDGFSDAPLPERLKFPRSSKIILAVTKGKNLSLENMLRYILYMLPFSDAYTLWKNTTFLLNYNIRKWNDNLPMPICVSLMLVPTIRVNSQNLSSGHFYWFREHYNENVCQKILPENSEFFSALESDILSIKSWLLLIFC